MFNGFLFAVNVSGISRAAYKYPQELFDRNNLVFGQEDDLLSRMTKFGIIPKVAMHVFFYHFKSVTVGSANTKAFYLFQNAISRARINSSLSNGLQSWKVRLHFDTNSTKVIHEAVGNNSADTDKSVGKVSGSSIVVQMRGSKAVDIRDSLHYFHPEEDAKHRLQRKAEEILPGSLASNPKQFVDNDSTELRMGQLYSRYASLKEPSSSDFSVYPANVDLMNDMGDAITSLDSLELFAEQRIVIAIATSSLCLHILKFWKGLIVAAVSFLDPLKNPSAGDIFTGHELGSALELRYNVEVVYLRKGPMWYSAAYLHRVDILITLLDDYDLSLLLSGDIRHAKDLTDAPSSG